MIELHVRSLAAGRDPCLVVAENVADEDQAIAALLHDAVEDQGALAQLADAFRCHAPSIAADRFEREVAEMEELAVRY